MNIAMSSEKMCSEFPSHNFCKKTHSLTNIFMYHTQSIQFYIINGYRYEAVVIIAIMENLIMTQ